MSQETKVGMFLIAAIAAILASILFLGDVHLLTRRPTYTIDFEDVEALPPKAAVKMSGVEVGKVKRVQLINGRARVTVGINAGIPLYLNASATVGTTGIIGTRFVQMDPGTPDAGPLKPGGMIQGLKGTTINNAFDRIASLFDEDKKYGSAVLNLKATIYNIRRVSESLNTALGNHALELEEIVMNLRDLSHNTKVLMANLADISTEKKQDLRIMIEKLKDVSVKLDDIMTKIQKGEGTIGALVSDKQTAENVKGAVASIKETADSAKKVLGHFTRITTYWNYRYRYSNRDEEGRSDAGIYFVPREGKFYYVGASHVGVVPEDEKHTKFERKNRFDALLGYTWGPLTGFGGVMRSSGGAGLKLKPLWGIKNWADRFELSAEINQFSRDREVQGHLLDRAFVALGAQFALTRWLWVGVRDEEILERPDVMGYANVVLKDEDLAYLLGLASFAR
ncbi:MAG: MlaD family protein [Elusimicrobia bacterium]|nr:MlaD family protein [Candidatus Obscuribacterium magneticum]